MPILTISYPQHSLHNGFFAIQYDPSGWTVYHESDRRQAVWNTVELSEARLWSRLPDFKRYVGSHGIQSAITPDGWLEIYIPWSATTPFGTQTGYETHRVRTLPEIRKVLGY